MFRKKSDSAPPDDDADADTNLVQAPPVVAPVEAPADVAPAPVVPAPAPLDPQVLAAAALVNVLVMRCRDGSHADLGDLRKLEADIRALASV